MQDARPSSVPITRRHFASTLSAGVLTSCALAQTNSAARLHTRPAKPSTSKEAGTHSLGLRSERDSILHIPKTLDPDKPAPLVVYLHGATGNEQQGIRRIAPAADEAGFL